MDSANEECFDHERKYTEVTRFSLSRRRPGRGGKVPVYQRATASVALAISTPALVVGCALIRAQSPGPLLYRAKRVGKDGHIFTMYKLRTMHESSAHGSALTTKSDPRIFLAGKVLRAIKVDELPQLWNVIVGDMCIFGPRPEDPEIVNKSYEPWMFETLNVPPGIVGPGSLCYFADEAAVPTDPLEAERYYVHTQLPRKIARDLAYVRHGTLKYEAALAIRTLLGIARVDCSNFKSARLEDLMESSLSSVN